MKSNKKKTNTKKTAQELGLKRIAVIDQSYTHPGFSVWDLETHQLLNYQTFSYEKYYDNRTKRTLQANALCNLVNMFGCNAVIAEEPRMFPSAQTKARLHEILATISDYSVVPVYLANTTGWKARTAGHRATKEQTVLYVAEKFHATVDDDIADAICIGEAVDNGLRLGAFD